MSDPLRSVGTRVTPQSEPVPGRERDQVKNSAGGYVFATDDWAQLHRFLILGTTGGTYYVSERKATLDNVEVLNRLAADDATGVKVVDLLIEISEAARAPKVQPTIYALAVCAASPSLRVRQAALQAVPRICRTGTHLYTFAEYVQNQRGWGRGLRRAIAAWYTEPDVAKVAYAAIKYRQREGWTHRDLLRLSHPRSSESARKVLYDWICGREIATEGIPELAIIEGYQRIQSEENAGHAAKLVEQYRLPWEAVPDRFLKDTAVWETLMDAGMGITALIRNLARLTSNGVLRPLGERTDWVANRITDADVLRAGKVHPMQALDALVTYGQGHGAKGKGEWEPISQLVDALDRAFYLCFANVEAAGKRTMLALDVSGSMSWGPCAGSAVLTPRTGSAAMALVTMATEPRCFVTAFTSTGSSRHWESGIEMLSVSPRQRLDDVLATIDALSMGGTDCALPMLYATEKGLEVDTFVTYTDNETWAGNIQPFQALEQYRQASGITDARNVVVGMTSGGFTLADPRDPGMLDCVGFDAATPAVISEFSAGRV